MEDTERYNLYTLNKIRSEDSENENKPQKTRVGSTSKPNPGVYMFLIAIAGTGDLIGLIPVLGALLRLPFSGIIWLWRLMSGNFKTSPAQKIMTNGLLGALPLPSCLSFVVSCYLEESKSEKTFFGKAQKLAKLIK